MKHESQMVTYACSPIKSHPTNSVKVLKVNALRSVVQFAAVSSIFCLYLHLSVSVYVSVSVCLCVCLGGGL